MPEINRQTNTTNMIWQLIDKETGAENAGITWAFRVGDRIKIRLANEMDQDHPMHHPFHIHGAGRFLVLSRDGEPEENLVWKDTVLLRAGQTIDILLDVTNPGAMDGPLPHRRAHRERDDVQLRRGPRRGPELNPRTQQGTVDELELLLCTGSSSETVARDIRPVIALAFRASGNVDRRAGLLQQSEPAFGDVAGHVPCVARKVGMLRFPSPT